MLINACRPDYKSLVISKIAEVLVSFFFLFLAVSTNFFQVATQVLLSFPTQAIRSFPASDQFTSIFVISTMRIFSRRYLSQTVDQRHGDIPLFVCCFTSGLLDSVSFNNWGVFVGMQTGTQTSSALQYYL